MNISEALLTADEADQAWETAYREALDNSRPYPKKQWVICSAQLAKAIPIIEAPLKGVIAGLTDALERTKESKEREVAQARKEERERIIKQIEELNLLLVRFDGGGDSYTEVPLGSTQEWAALKGEQP